MGPDLDRIHDAWRRASDTLDFTDEQRACLLAAECLRIIDPSQDPPSIPSPGPKASMAAIFVTHEPQFDDFTAPGSPISPSVDELQTPLDFDLSSAPSSSSSSSAAPKSSDPSTFPFPAAASISDSPGSISPPLSPSHSPSPSPSTSSGAGPEAGPSRPRSADGYPLPPSADGKTRRVQFAALPRPQLLRAAQRSPSPESAWSESSPSPSPTKTKSGTGGEAPA